MMETEYEILDYIYKNSAMGYESTMTLLKTLEDKENKIKDIVQDLISSYKDFCLPKDKSSKIIYYEFKLVLGVYKKYIRLKSVYFGKFNFCQKYIK